MELEFELDFEEVSNGDIIYSVKRKGLRVGTLKLDKEPYAQSQALKNFMKLTNELK